MFSIKVFSLLFLCIWYVHGEFICPRPRGYYPHPHQCKKYYVCMNSKSSLQMCPDQMLFDVKKRSCFTHSKVKCGNRVQEDKTEMPVNNTHTEYTVSDNLVHVTFNNTPPHPIDYNVTDVTSVDESEWISRNVTDFVSNVTNIVSGSSTDASSTVNVSDAEHDWVTESHKPENVTDFISDVNSTAAPQINSTVTRTEWINDTTRFENISSTAESLSNVTVTEEYITEDEFEWVTNSSRRENVTLMPIQSTFKLTTEEITTLSDYDDDYPVNDVIVCPDAYGLFPHPTDRHKYIHCQEWYPHVLTCPANLVFDNIKKVCVWRIKRH